jgi:two-component system response regulator CssR
MTYRVFLVEDEPNLNRLLATYLEKEGWAVTAFERGEPARDAIHQRPDLWILDIMLPDVDGFELIREIKVHDATVPVIFISARDEDLDRIVGLEMGSDDYLSKPFLPRELVIRAKKILARVYGGTRQDSGMTSSGGGAAQAGTPVMSTTAAHRYAGPYCIVVEQRSVWLAEERIDLTSKEFELVCFFTERVGLAFSREQLLTSVWGDDYFGSDRVVDDLIRRIRKKMPDFPLETIYGFGYRLVKSL